MKVRGLSLLQWSVRQMPLCHGVRVATAPHRWRILLLSGCGPRGIWWSRGTRSSTTWTDGFGERGTPFRSLNW